MKQGTIIHILAITLLTVLTFSSHSLYGMQALRNKQAQVAQEQGVAVDDATSRKIKKENAVKRAKMKKAGSLDASIVQLNLDKQDLQTRSTCGTCDLFIAYAIDEILKNHTEINTQTMHAQLTKLGYGTCIQTCKVNIEAAEFTDTLINDLKRSKQEADEIVTRIFVLGYEGAEGVFPTATHAYTGQEYYEGLAVPGQLADLSLQLRKGDIPAVHFICNVGAPEYGQGAKKVTDYTAHWVLFSVINYKKSITVYYIDSAENNPLSNRQLVSQAYIRYIATHMGLTIQ
jgi:hypothetical protein